MPTYTITDPFSLMMLLLKDALEGVGAIQQVVKDMGQLETRESPAIMPYTALVSFQNWTFSNQGNLAQTGEGDVIIKTTGPMYNTPNSNTPVDSKEDAVKYLALAHDVYLAVHGQDSPWTSNDYKDIFGKLTRTGFTEDLRRPGLGVAVARYRMTLEDRTASTTKSKTAVVPGLTITFNDPGD